MAHFKPAWELIQLHTTTGFVQLGHDIETIIGSAYPSIGLGGRNSVGH
ncbi:hypothetical protein BH10BAC3_BH10BAC3_39320 [soil metagenome]